jgi:hypothetical protein
MNRLLLIVCLFCSVWSCEKSFDTEAIEKEVPVVYGILNVNDSIQYIRVERAFLSKGKSVFELAKDPDVIYYPSGKAYLSVPGTGKIIEGKRINAADIGFGRENGPFVQTPNVVYSFSTTEWKLNPPSKVVFTFESPSLSHQVSSEISVLKELQLRDGVPSVPLILGYDRIVTVGWSNSAEAKVFDVKMKMNYQEKSNQTNGVFLNKSLVWELKNNLEPGADPLKGSYTFKGVDFYKFLANSLVSSPNIQRIMLSVDFILSAGGVEFKEILNLNQANFGLTGSNNIPRYNNIINGIGFFSSRIQVVRPDISLASGTLDSLKNGIYTKSLQFK